MRVTPQIGDFVRVRTRRWLVEGERSGVQNLSALSLACVDDDAQGETADVVWDAELDAEILGDEGWDALSRSGTDDLAVFAAYIRTLRWNTATAADRDLFQAPFRAGIADGLDLLCTDEDARLAFRAMNEAVARALRQRNAGPEGDPAAQQAPRWRPFQIAFILLNLRGLQDPLHADREVVDLLFFPTGGGKTEAYLGLAAWTIAHRRLTNHGLLGAGVTVLMRYTLRLLTLDQLSRAAGVVCALELMRGEAAWQKDGKRLLGDWPIEIGLWVGSAASPNRLGKTGDGR